MNLLNKIGKKALIALAVSCLSLGITANAAEVVKRDTVFVIKDMHNGYPGPSFPLGIFGVNGNKLTDINTSYVPTNKGSAIGLAISTKNKLLFVSHEGWGVVDVINAETGAPLPDLTIPSTSNIAGIVVSESRNRFYAVNRGSTHLFVYNMQSDGTVTEVPGEEFDLVAGAYGLDVWGNKLYATHGYSQYNTVTVYDLDKKKKVNEYTTTNALNMAIAVDGSDSSNVMVYTTWTSQNPANGILTQYNINTGVEKFIAMGRDGRGVSVNPALGLVYAATGDNSDATPAELRTYGEGQFKSDMTNSPTPLDSEDLIQGGGGATDVLAVGVTFNPDVTIEITEPADKNVSLCNYVTFTMTVKNPVSDQMLIIDGMEDNYDTTQMKFVESSVTPDDMTDDGNITWSNLNHSIAADGTWTFTTRFLAVKEETAAYETIKITDAALADGTPVAFENTIYFDIAYSTAECTTPPTPIPPVPEPCCTPELEKRDSGSALGTFSIILFAMLTLLAGSLAIRRDGLQKS